MYRLFLFTLFCFFTDTFLYAQTGCCDNYYNEGQNALKNALKTKSYDSYAEAKRLFIKGSKCPDNCKYDFNKEIEKVNAKLKDIEKAEVERKKREREAAAQKEKERIAQKHREAAAEIERTAQQQRNAERKKLEKEKEDKRLRDKADQRERERIAQAAETKRLQERDTTILTEIKQINSFDNDFVRFLKAVSEPSFGGAMVFVEGGTFQMGSNDNDDSEKPIHPVTLSSFSIGKYEITVTQFEAFIKDMAYKTDADKEGWSYVYEGSSWIKKNGVNWKYDVNGNLRPQNEYNHPVIHVSWNDAVAFSEWLSKITSKYYRLPTEAEWEYAARGGNKSNGYKYSGTNALNDVAWNTTNSSSKTHTVGSLKPNELGIYDMSGNVWEWCSDRYDVNYYKNSPSQNPKGSAWGSSRVLRGGSWDFNVKNCHVALRSYNVDPTNRSYGGGFRVVRND
jgi:formylglycine-generating enzyme required for sulfatase activity